MKKILIAFDVENPDQQSMIFGSYLADLTHSGLTGVFLENLPPKTKPGVKFAYGSVYVETIGAEDQSKATLKQQAAAQIIQDFRDACEVREIPCRVHLNQDVPLEELMAESRYADVILTSPGLFASSAPDQTSGLVKELLAKSECPVIITPLLTRPIEEILLAYDGSASSVFAIKQFTYLFPELDSANVTVLQANVAQAKPGKANQEKLYEYLKEHYKNIVFKELDGKPEDELFDYTLRRERSCLVMGSFGRNWLSRLFHHSTAELLLQLNNLPLFIAHR